MGREKEPACCSTPLRTGRLRLKALRISSQGKPGSPVPCSWDVRGGLWGLRWGDSRKAKLCPHEPPERQLGALAPLHGSSELPETVSKKWPRSLSPIPSTPFTRVTWPAQSQEREVKSTLGEDLEVLQSPSQPPPGKQPQCPVVTEPQRALHGPHPVCSSSWGPRLTACQ